MRYQFYRPGSWRNILCNIIGHRSSGKVTTVYSCDGPLYDCDICPWCYKRVPVSDEDARKKAAMTAQVSAVMNGARRQYGLGPLSWED